MRLVRMIFTVLDPGPTMNAVESVILITVSVDLGDETFGLLLGIPTKIGSHSPRFRSLVRRELRARIQMAAAAASVVMRPGSQMMPPNFHRTNIREGPENLSLPSRGHLGSMAARIAANHEVELGAILPILPSSPTSRMSCCRRHLVQEVNPRPLVVAAAALRHQLLLLHEAARSVVNPPDLEAHGHGFRTRLGVGQLVRRASAVVHPSIHGQRNHYRSARDRS